MRLLLLTSLWSLVLASAVAADYVVLPVKCVRADGRLFIERSAPTSLRIVGSFSKRPYTICAPKNGRYCRTLNIHRFDVMCAGRRIAWRDVAATIIRQRGAKAAVADGRLSFQLTHKSFSSLNAFCDAGYRAGVGLKAKSSHCSNKGYVPRVAIELPSGFAPLSELGGRLTAKPLVRQPAIAKREPVVTETRPTPTAAQPRGRIPLAGNETDPAQTKPIRVAAVGKTTMTLPAEGNAARQANGRAAKPAEAALAKSEPSPQTSSRPAARQPNTGKSANTVVPAVPVAAPVPRDATQSEAVPGKPLQVAAAGKVGVATAPQPSWSDMVTEAVKANFTAATKSGPQMQQSLIATVIGLALITSLISGIGWFATQQLLSLRTRTNDPYQLILRREVVDLAKPDAQMCGELCRTGQGLIGDIQGRVGDIKGAAPLRRVLLREVRAMEQFLATTIQTAPDDPREWRRMRLRLQRVVTDLIRLKDITDGARRSLTSRIISEDLPRDKQEAYEVLGANPEASEKILKRLVDALRATWHPDLATGDDDRDLRDRRIKQINVAWDLITDKRSEA